MIKDPTPRKSSPFSFRKQPFYTLAVVTLGGLISACNTLPSGHASSGSIDLSSSYAVPVGARSNGESHKEVHRDPRAYYNYLLALKAERDADFSKAATHYQKVVEYDSHSEEIHEKLAGLLLRSGRFDELADFSKRALELFPKNLALNMIMGDILAGRGEYYSAIKYYGNVARMDPGGARAYLLQGTVYEELKQYDRAQEMFKKVVLSEPSNPLGHHYLGRSYLKQNNLEDAERSLEKSVSLRPNFVHSREHLAWVLKQQGKLDQARREYKLLLKLNPRNKRVREHLESLQGENGDSKDAQKGEAGIPKELEKQPDVHMNIATIFYEQAIYLKALDEFQLTLLKEDRKEPHMLMARIYEILGKLDKSIEEFEILRKMNPESVEILRYTARLYSLNQQPEEAVKLLKKAVEMQPENDSLYHSLSLAYMTSEKYDLAIENMRTAITLNDSKDSYYFELGALLERSGEYDSAIENMQRAIEINPMHSNAHNFLGYMYATQGRYLDKALTHLKKALSIQPRNGYFLDSLGWIYYKKGESQKALQEIKKAMVYTAPDPVLYDHLGDIQFSLKNYSEASGAWKTSLSLTRIKKEEDEAGELPDPKVLKEKIEKAHNLLRQGF